MYQMTVHRIKRNFWRVKRELVYNKVTRDLEELVNETQQWKGSPDYIFTFGDLTGFVQDPWDTPSVSQMEDPGIPPEYDYEGEKVPF